MLRTGGTVPERAMKVRTRLSVDAAAWLRRQDLGVVLAFQERLAEVRADERAVLLHTEPIKEPDLVHMTRKFVFGDRYVAIIEWNVSAGTLRVVRCRRSKPEDE